MKWKWFTEQILKVKEVILGLLGIGISFTAQDIASNVILYGSAFLIGLGVLKVTLGIKLPLVKYFEPLMKPFRATRFAEEPTRSGEELGIIIINVDEKIGGKKMREKITGFLKNKLVVNKFTNGSFLVVFIALFLFIGNQYLEVVDNLTIEAVLGFATIIAAYVLRKLKLETNEEYDARSQKKDYRRKEKADERAAKLLIKKNEKERKERVLKLAMEEVKNQDN